jgi:hypothetical protein
LFRDAVADDEGIQGMSTRQNICAIERAAQAGPAPALILGTLLLLIRP